MRILFVASECAPFVKTGGLADVIGAVPKALAAAGAEVRVLLPAYPALAKHLAGSVEAMAFPILFGGPARIMATQAEGIDLLLLDAPHLYDRPGSIYLGLDGLDWADNDLRFAALSWAGAEIAKGGLGDWRPDVVNAHDWQAGLVPAYLRQAGDATPVVATIHNVAFQGLFDATRLAALGLDASLFTQDGVEYFGKISFLKAALALSDKITTVSPTYARELLTPEFGMGLDGVLRARQGDLHGILNGVDIDVWNPETDASLPRTYTARTLKARAANRAEIQSRFALDPSREGPLFCVVSRLTSQKGLDMLLECLPGLVAAGASLALIGTGEPWLEEAFVAASYRYAGAVGVVIGYDEALSHLLQGGADAILIPSRFEPCGLTQLYGLRYGCLPVVARTGGLADTVIDANEAALVADCATGVQFAPVTATMLGQAVARTCALYREPKVWAAMQRRAMRHPVGWDSSAKAYLDVYRAALAK